MPDLTIFLKAKDDASKTLTGIRGLLGNIGTVAAGIGVAYSVKQGFSELAGGLRDSFAAAQEAKAAQAQLNAVLNSTGGSAGVTAEEVDKLSRSMMHHSTVDDDVVKSGAALLLTFTNIKDNIFPGATQAALDMSAAMGEDLQSSVIQIGKALNNPITGMTALQRVGVTFSESQKELIKTLVESGHSLEAQKIILGELNKEFGGSAQAARDAQGPLASLKNTYDDTQEAIGRLLQGGLVLFSDWVSQHKQDFAEIWEQAKPALQGFVDFIEAAVGGVITQVKAIIDSISGGIALIDDLIHGRWQSAWEDAKNIVGDVGMLIVGQVETVFGSLPDIMISGVEAGINGVLRLIEQVPSIKVPGFVPGIGGNTIFGGLAEGSLGNVSLPRVGTPNAPNYGKIFDDISAAGEKLPGTFQHAADGSDDLGDATAKAASSIYDTVSSIRSAASALFGAPTREELGNQLATANLEGRLARLPTSAGNTDLSESDLAKQREYLQAQIEASRASGEAMQAQNKIQQIQLQLADQTTLTEKEQNTAFQNLLTATRDLTTPINNAADAMGITLIKSVDDVLGAHGNLASLINTDVIPAKQSEVDAAGRVVKAMDAVSARVLSLFSAPTPTQDYSSYDQGLARP